MKKIGPSFISELQAAGLAGLPFSWNADGEFLFMTEPSDMVPNPMTAEQIAAVKAVYNNHIPDVPLPDPVPQVVSRYQGREAMHLTEFGDRSLFEAVEELISAETTPAYYKRAWDELQQFERDSPMLQAIADILGLTSYSLDNIFRLAATLKA